MTIKCCRSCLRRSKDLDLTYGRAFTADSGFNSNDNLKLYLMNMILIIKQRVYSQKQHERNAPAKTYREMGAKLFDLDVYNMRLLIKGIFGAEEAKRHQLLCRFLLEDNQTRYGKFRAIAWNLRVLSKFRCANALGIPIPSYGNIKDATTTEDSSLHSVLA